MNILFVCNGNRSRSAMASAYFNQLCKQNNLPVTSVSAGIKVTEPSPATADAVELFELLNIDLKSHLSQAVTPELINDAEAIVCMTAEQVDAIKAIVSPAESKTRTLLSLTGDESDLKDPEKGIPESFQECFQSMMPALAELADRIMRSQA